MTQTEVATEWQVRGSYFEGCNCEAICPCRAVNGQPGGPSSYGVRYGAVSWCFEHPGTEMYADVLHSTDEMLRWEIRGGRNASFATDFAYTSGA